MQAWGAPLWIAEALLEMMTILLFSQGFIACWACVSGAAALVDLLHPNIELLSWYCINLLQHLVLTTWRVKTGRRKTTSGFSILENIGVLELRSAESNVLFFYNHQNLSMFIPTEGRRNAHSRWQIQCGSSYVHSLTFKIPVSPVFLSFQTSPSLCIFLFAGRAEWPFPSSLSVSFRKHSFLLTLLLFVFLLASSLLSSFLLCWSSHFGSLLFAPPCVFLFLTFI